MDEKPSDDPRDDLLMEGGRLLDLAKGDWVVRLADGHADREFAVGQLDAF